VWITDLRRSSSVNMDTVRGLRVYFFVLCYLKDKERTFLQFVSGLVRNHPERLWNSSGEISGFLLEIAYALSFLNSRKELDAEEKEAWDIMQSSGILDIFNLMHTRMK